MSSYADFAGFVDAMGERRRRAAELSSPLLRAMRRPAPHPDGAGGEAPASDPAVAVHEAALHEVAVHEATLHEASDLLADTVAELGHAEEELRAQNEALFRACTELEDEHQVFRTLFEQAPIAYLVTDAHGIVQRANHVACALLGRSINALVGRPLALHVAPDDRKAFRTALSRSAQSGRVETWPVRLGPTRGEPVECRVHTRTIRSDGGAVPGAAPILHWVVTEEPSYPSDDLV